MYKIYKNTTATDDKNILMDKVIDYKPYITLYDYLEDNSQLKIIDKEGNSILYNKVNGTFELI